MVEEMMVVVVVVRLVVRVMMFSASEAMVKLVTGSVVFMLSRPWMEKNSIRLEVFARMVCVHICV